MKKILAIAMALVMMMSVMVPVFAGELTQEDGKQSGEATVQTDISGINGDGTYTVTYNATMNLTWDTTVTNFDYSVSSHLKAGKCVAVAIADKDANGTELVSADGDKIPYTLGGTVSTTTSTPVIEVGDEETFQFSVNVAEDKWDEAPYAVYTDVLTITTSVADL